MDAAEDDGAAVGADDGDDDDDAANDDAADDDAADDNVDVNDDELNFNAVSLVTGSRVASVQYLIQNLNLATFCVNRRSSGSGF